MLSLNLQVGESVMIGDNIVVTVIEGNRGGVQLSFDAPREIPINREVVYNKIKAKEANDKSDHQRQSDPRTRQTKRQAVDLRSTDPI